MAAGVQALPQGPHTLTSMVGPATQHTPSYPATCTSSVSMPEGAPCVPTSVPHLTMSLHWGLPRPGCPWRLLSILINGTSQQFSYGPE